MSDLFEQTYRALGGDSVVAESAASDIWSDICDLDEDYDWTSCP